MSKDDFLGEPADDHHAYLAEDSPYYTSHWVEMSPFSSIATRDCEHSPGVSPHCIEILHTSWYTTKYVVGAVQRSKGIRTNSEYAFVYVSQLVIKRDLPVPWHLVKTSLPEVCDVWSQRSLWIQLPCPASGVNNIVTTIIFMWTSWVDWES